MADVDPPFTWFGGSIIKRDRAEQYVKGTFKQHFEMGEWVYVRLQRNPRLPASEWVRGMVVGIQLSWKTRYRLAFPVELDAQGEYMAVTEYRFQSTDMYRSIPTDEKPSLALVHSKETQT